MARSTAVRTVDDITGELAAETVRFALDGVEYDIDLTADNAEALRTVLERYLDRGRRTGDANSVPAGSVGGTGRGRSGRSRTGTTPRPSPPR